MVNCFPAVRLLTLLLGVTAAIQAAGPSLRVTSVVRPDIKTGRLVRRTFAPSVNRLRPREFRDLVRVDQLVNEAARKYGVDPLLVQSVIEVESNYNPFAISPKGAEGLMQLLAPTARRFGVKNSFSPSDNIEGGVRYLKYLQELFRDERLVLAAYNAGEGAVSKYNRRVPPYQETVVYVQRVRARYDELRGKSRPRGEDAPQMSPDEPDFRPLEAFVDSEGRFHMRTR